MGIKSNIILKNRGMAKFGIALGSGPRGLGFESRYSDHEKSVDKKSTDFSAKFAVGELDFLRKLNWLTPANLPVGS